jgi:putative ABC transport system permease protein
MIPISYNVRSVGVRKGTTAATAGGLAMVSFVLATVLMLSNGIDKTMGESGARDIAVVLRTGAESESYSLWSQGQVPLILNEKSVARDGSTPRGVAEVVLVIGMQRAESEVFGQVTIRGGRPESKAFRPNFQVVAGRQATAGTNEVVIGKGIRRRYKGADLDGTILFGKDRPFKVVGIFSCSGCSAESEVWGDLENIQSATGRTGFVSSVRVKLTRPDALGALKASLESNRRLGVQAVREVDYFDKLSLGTRAFIAALGGLLTLFFSLAAIIGATITMHASISDRKREIGALRALGFSKSAILFGFMLESATLATMGGVVGALISLLMGLVEFKTTNFSSWSEVVFRLEPTLPVLATAIGVSALVGVLAGFPPALRAARMPVLQALRGG